MAVKPLGIAEPIVNPIGILSDAEGDVIAIDEQGVERVVNVGDPVYQEDLVTSVGAGSVEFKTGDILQFSSNMHIQLDDEVFSADRHQDSLGTIVTSAELAEALELLVSVDTESLSIEDILDHTNDELLSDTVSKDNFSKKNLDGNLIEGAGDNSIDPLLFRDPGSDSIE